MNKLLLTLIAFLSIAMRLPAQVPEPVLRAQANRAQVTEQVSQATLAIFPPNGEGGGSGVLISPNGLALTNFHVTQPCGPSMKCGMNDGLLYDAVLVGVDPTGDVALIKLLGRDDFPHVPLGDSDKVHAGDWAWVIGNPFLLAEDLHPSVSYGIISGVHRYQYPGGTLLEYADCLQTDASINPGNSGGPLFNEQGELIGINGRGSFEKRGRVNVGVGYAVSSNQIKKFLGYLSSGRIVDHATAGFTVLADDQNNVLVSNILEYSDAFRRGLRYDDQIVSFGGRSITSVNVFKNILGTFPKGWRVSMTYRHEGRDHDTWIRLRAVHYEGQLAAMVEGEAAQRPRRRRRPIEPPKKPGDEKKSDKQDGNSPEEGQKKEGDTKEGDSEGAPNDPHDQNQDAPGSQNQLPAIVQQHYEAKTGFANYYFNRLHKQRLWDNQLSASDLRTHANIWMLDGVADKRGDFSIELNNDTASFRIATGEARIDVSDNLSEQLDPPRSGGMLVSLAMWRRWLLLGPEHLGQTTFLGIAPAPGSNEPMEVLVAISRGVEFRLYFDQKSMLLRVLEMYPEEDVDPCELHFSDYDESLPRLPGHITVVHGDDIYDELTIAQFHFSDEVTP